MKTEKEFSDFFVESCQHENKFNDYVHNIAGTYWIDLTGHLNTYFTNEDRLQITKKAAELLSENIKTTAQEQAWPIVIRDFLQNNYWGFQSTTKKPKLKQTEEQQVFWKFFKYTWAFIQSMFIIKTAVYFFGIKAASNPDQVSIGWMWLFFTISAASLFFFAYRNRNDKD